MSKVKRVAWSTLFGIMEKMRLYIAKTDRYNRKVQKQDGRQLLERALGSKDYQRIEILTGAYGKPYLKNSTKQFNISHSGEYVVLAFSDNVLGVDIQEKRDCRREAIVRRFFTTAEQEAFAAAEDCRKTDLFYHIWCRKEAYGKYLGVGLQESVMQKDVCSPIDGCHFIEYEMIGYQISICCGKEEELEEVIDLSEGL